MSATPRTRRLAVAVIAVVLVVVALPLANAWVRRSVMAAVAEGVRDLWREPALVQTWRLDSGVGQVAVSPDGQHVAVASNGGVQLREADTGTLVRSWVGTGRPHFIPDGYLLMTSARGGIHVVPLRNGDREQNIGIGQYLELAVSGDGRVLAGRKLRQIELWHLSDRQLQRTIEVGEGGCWGLALSHDGSMIACIRGRDVEVWRVADGTLLHHLTGYTGPGLKLPVYEQGGRSERDAEVIRSIAFSPDGTLLAAGSGQAIQIDSVEQRTEDHVVRIWDVQRGTLIHTLTQPQLGVESVAVSADGRLIAAAGGYRDMEPQAGGFLKMPQDAVIRVWDVASGRLLRELHGHKGLVTSVTFSPVGGWLASGSEDGTVRVWQVPEEGRGSASSAGAR